MDLIVRCPACDTTNVGNRKQMSVFCYMKCYRCGWQWKEMGKVSHGSFRDSQSAKDKPPPPKK